MQDKYAGDIGDFGKFGLLCRLADIFRIGINWYNSGAPDSDCDRGGTYRQKDGKYRDFSSVIKWNDDSAKELARKLESLKNAPLISKLEELALVDDAVYYREIVPRENESREAWHNAALKRFEKCDIVFLDPDNGLLCDSVTEGSAKSVKYAYYKEVEDYLKQVKSVIIYNHRCRKKENVYLSEVINKLCFLSKAERSRIQVITFRRFAVRDYFIISNDEDTHRRISEILKGMLDSDWGKGSRPFCTQCNTDFSKGGTP